MPLLVGGALLVVLALLSLSAGSGAEGRKKSENTVLGALTVAVVVFVLGRAGFLWLGIGLALLWGASQQLRRPSSSDASAPRPAGSSKPGEARTGAGPRRSARLTRAEAFQVLGLPPDASPERILAEYRRLMKKVHPDQGGTTYLATQLNEAKDVLLGDS